MPAFLRRIIGKRVKSPYGPAAVREEFVSGPVFSHEYGYHWETGKREETDEDAQVRRPALPSFVPAVWRGDKLRTSYGRWLGADEIRKTGLS